MNWGNLHNIHRSTMLSGDCDVCHIGGDDFPVYIASSNGGDGFESGDTSAWSGVVPVPFGDRPLVSGALLVLLAAGAALWRWPRRR